jgi:Domain of unknown function (DUF4419)
MHLTKQDLRGGTVVEVSESAPIQRVEVASNSEFIHACLGSFKKLHYKSTAMLATTSPSKTGRQISRLFMAAHDAFTARVPLSLSPEVLWYTIVHEVAVFIKGAPELNAGYFNATPGRKETIRVEDDSLIYGGNNDWEGSIALIKQPLRAKLPPATMDAFLPRFSTLTTQSEAAILVSFMDAISAYFEFGWTTFIGHHAGAPACGIPKIRFEGTEEDWELLYEHASRLSGLFGGGALKPYFTHLLPVIAGILRTVRGEMPSLEGDVFWPSIYVVLGGPEGQSVRGWLTAFTAHLHTRNGPVLKETFDWTSSGGTLRVDHFPAHLSTVDFGWKFDNGRVAVRIPMGFAAGVLGVDHDEGFLASRLGVAVYEKNAD